MPNTKLDMNLNQYLINLNLQQICIRIMDDYGYTCIFVEIKAIDKKKQNEKKSNNFNFVQN